MNQSHDLLLGQAILRELRIEAHSWLICLTACEPCVKPEDETKRQQLIDELRAEIHGYDAMLDVKNV